MSCSRCSDSRSLGCRQPVPAVATSPPRRWRGSFVASAFLSRNGFWIYQIDVWRSMRTCQQSERSACNPSHIVLQPTPNWAWQLGRFTLRDCRRRSATWSLHWSLVLRLYVFRRSLSDPRVVQLPSSMIRVRVSRGPGLHLREGRLKRFLA